MLDIKFNVGDVVRMKKAHPCGSFEWEITRTGMDFGLKCKGCGHFVMIARPKFIKAVKAVSGSCVCYREIKKKKNAGAGGGPLLFKKESKI